MNKDEYIREIQRRRKRRIRVVGITFLTPPIIMLALFLLVQYGALIGIPANARDYMLRTGPFDFSSKELNRYIEDSPSSSVSSSILIGIYWVYIAAVGLPGLLLTFSPILRRLKILTVPAWERGLSETSRIEAKLYRFLETRSLTSKLA